MRCISEIPIHDKECLPKCSGLQISSYDKESIEKNKELFQSLDTFNSMQLEFLEGKFDYMLPSSLTSWSMYKCKR